MALLTSEHDGIRRFGDGDGTSILELDRVHFREDELIASDGQALVERLRPTSLAMHCSVLVGQLRARRRHGVLPAAHVRRLDRLFAGLLDGFADGRLATSLHDLMVLHRQLEMLLTTPPVDTCIKRDTEGRLSVR